MNPHLPSYKDGALTIELQTSGVIVVVDAEPAPVESRSASATDVVLDGGEPRPFATANPLGVPDFLVSDEEPSWLQPAAGGIWYPPFNFGFHVDRMGFEPTSRLG